MLIIPVTSSDHIQGEENAPVTLVEYGDYECPYCGSAYPIVKRVQKHFGKQLRFIFRNFPLVEMHPDAGNAAMCAEFAADNHKFWEMHDLLYENQENLDLPHLIQYTESLDLSAVNFNAAIKNETDIAKIKNDFMGGVRSGVNGTPTFFINDARHNGSFEYDDLVIAINQASK
jgi:protein-disulfide isomerase